jgi:hypothetical protein
MHLSLLHGYALLVPWPILWHLTTVLLAMSRTEGPKGLSVGVDNNTS